MQLKEFKIRCSAIGLIMTEARSKSEPLSQTCISYLEQWVKEQLYNTKKQINSKYLTKGNEVEVEAIEYYAESKNLGFVLKNQDDFENDFITGTPDLITNGIVYDFKSSWDCFTFPLFETKVDKNYEAQLQGYMNLTGLQKAKLVYTLQNTPDQLQWDEPIDYSIYPDNLRIKEFEIAYDSEFIERVNNRVIECRNYIKTNLEIK
jgi:uncharacterized protein Usg